MTRHTILLLVMPVAVVAAGDLAQPYLTALAACEQASCPEQSALLARAGRFEHSQGRYPEAVRLLDRAAALGADVDLALAEALRKTGASARAEEVTRRALARASGDTTRYEATSLLASILASAGRAGEAAAAYRSAAKLGGERFEVLNNLGSAEAALGHAEAAGRLYQESLRLRRSPEVLNNLAAVRLSQGNRKDAERLIEQATAIWEQELGPESPKVAAALTSLVGLEIRRKDFARAEENMARAWTTNRIALPFDQALLAKDLSYRAALHAARGDHRAAIDDLRSALAIDTPSLPRGKGLLWIQLAEEYNRVSEPAPALEAFERGLTILESARSVDHRQMAAWLDEYAAALRRNQQFVEAARREMQAMRVRVSAALAEQRQP